MGLTHRATHPIANMLQQYIFEYTHIIFLYFIDFFGFNLFGF